MSRTPGEIARPMKRLLVAIMAAPLLAFGQLASQQPATPPAQPKAAEEQPLTAKEVKPSQPADEPGALKDEDVFVLSPFEVRSDGDVGYLAANTLGGTRLNTALADTPAPISVMTSEFLKDINATNLIEASEYSVGFKRDHTGVGNGNAVVGDGLAIQSRALPTTIGRDYFRWVYVADPYNIDRIDFSAGPNSVLFGNGSPGGVVNVSTKQAKFANFASTTPQFDDYGSWRFTLDVNRKLSDSLAVRVNALLSDSRTWRDLEFRRDKWIATAFTWRLTNKIQLKGNVESAVIDQMIGFPYGAQDQVLNWLNNGRPTYSYPANSTGVLATGLSRFNNTVPRLTFSKDNASASWLNFQGFGVSTPAPNSSFQNLDESVWNFKTPLNGPGARVPSHLWTYSAYYNHEILKNLSFEAAFNQQSYIRNWIRPLNQTPLYGDPNITLPNGSPNPHVGQLYVEDQFKYFELPAQRRTMRAMLAYTLDPGTPWVRKWLGRHSFAVYLGNETTDSQNQQYFEVNKTPINPARPAYTDAANVLWRRTWLDVTGQKGLMYHDQDPYSFPESPAQYSDPLRTFAGTITPGFYRATFAPARTIVDTRMFAGQSHFLTDRLVLTYGWRKDVLGDKSSQPILDPVTREVVDAVLLRKQVYKGDTKTAGAVLHVTKSKSVSLFVNKSDTFAPQQARNMYNQNIGNIKGEGEDYGIRLSLPDNRLVLSYDRYETASANAATANLFNLVTFANAMWDAIDGPNGPHAILPNPRDGIDTVTKGWDISLTANPIKGMRMTASYSHALSMTDNNIPSSIAYVAEFLPVWQQNAAVPLIAGTNVPGGHTTVGGIINAPLGTLGLQQEIANQTVVNGRETVGNYTPGAFNFFGRYEIQSGRFKALGLSLGTQWRKAFVAGILTKGPDIGKKIYGDPLILWTAGVSYHRKLWHGKVTWRPNLTVSNVFDVGPVVRTAYFENAGSYRWFFQRPRTFTFSSEFSF